MIVQTITRETHDLESARWDFKDSSAIQYRPNSTTYTEVRVSPPLHEITRIVKDIIPDPRDEFAEYEVFIQISVNNPTS